MMVEADRRARQAIRCQLDRSNLTRERERELLILSQTAETPAARHTALREIWESHSKLVVAIASRFRRPDIELMDLVGAGHLGLYTAISRFDVARVETRLSSFAASWISWTIKDYIRRNCSMLRLPESNAHRQLAQFKGRLLIDARKGCIRDGVEPTEAALCQRIGSRIGLDPAEVAQCLRLLDGGVLSLHGTAAETSDAAALMDTLTDDTIASEDDVILRLDHEKARRRVLELARDVLGERERAVFLARCMATGNDVVTLEILADHFGVTRERIYQLEASAKRKIATVLVREGFDQLRITATSTTLHASGSSRRSIARRRQPHTSERLSA